MVKLNKLSLQGFKSFKNKTTLLIGDGLTCVTGGNGSGKSNLLDAFFFVLGKNSAKALRADKMEDLIYKSDKGGSESANVELEIDNSDKVIKVDEDVLLVGRKVNKQGQSTFRLNGKVETRQRILDLLREARIGPEGLNIVAQGDVTRVLEMNPAERRQIVDELAGLAEFDEKKKKSESELNKVEEILKEQNLLLGEKEKIFLNITEEKRKAEIYNELDNKIKRLKFSIVKTRFDESSGKKNRFSERAQDFEERLAKVNLEISSMDSEIGNKEQEIREITKTIYKGSEEVGIIEKQEKLKSEILRKEGKIEGNDIEISRQEKLIEQVSEIEKPRGVKVLLSKDGVIGTAEQMIEYEIKYKDAIDAALGSAKNNLIVNSFDKIDFYIKYLKENKIGTAKFLPLDKIEGQIIEAPKEKGVIDVASNLVNFDKKVGNAIEYLLGSTLVVETLDDSKRFIKKYRTVTLDGSLTERSGAVFGGYKKKGFDLGKIKKEIDVSKRSS
ncbi:MAG: AAA family ATPase [Candidatus Aenigmarchaeota archaeon]|nr:AAA family ATPase [Candidatus Aenigmarchaeota archaeon]